MTQLPYTTSNTHLALLLDMVGHKPIGAWNRYTADKLTSLGAATIKDALALGKPGHVEYFFERTAELMELVAAFFDQERKNKAQEPSETASDLSAEDAVRIGASVLMLRAAYATGWKKLPALFFSGGEAQDTASETIRVTRQMCERGPVVIDGREYKEGDTIKIKGSVNYSPMTCVGTKLSPELRQEVGV